MDKFKNVSKLGYIDYIRSADAYTCYYIDNNTIYKFVGTAYGC